MPSVTYTIEIKWQIRGFESYGFGSDKNLYNLKTNRRIKQSYNAGSLGYWFSKKFVTLSKLRSMLIKTPKQTTPF